MNCALKQQAKVILKNSSKECSFGESFCLQNTIRGEIQKKTVLKELKVGTMNSLFYSVLQRQKFKCKIFYFVNALHYTYK